MAHKPVPRILITNDDGIHAEGLKVLEQIANELSDEVWVVAPEYDQSGTSHSVSLQEPLRLYSWADRRHSVRGTPSDCVLLAVEHLMKERRPNLILSGVNRGHNLSDAVAYSGTVGAAMTGLLLNVPAIALSQAFRMPERVRWDTAARLAPPLIRALLERGWPNDVCLNINFPDVDADDVAGVALTRPARGALAGVEVEARTDTREQPYFWIRFRRNPEPIDAADGDVAAVREGRISISPLRFERDAAPDCRELAIGLDDCLKGA